MRRIFKSALIISISLFACISSAVVDLKNANYANTWIGMELEGAGIEFKVEQTYNSRSLWNGVFGFGWCTDFETKLEILPEGNLLLTYCGDGREVFYTRENFDAKRDMTEYIDRIMERYRLQEKVVAKEDLDRLRIEITTNSLKQRRLAKKLGIRSEAFSDGEIFLREGLGPEVIKYFRGTFTLEEAGGKLWRFDSKGRVTSRHDENGNYLRYIWVERRLAEMVDNHNRSIVFEYGANGKVSLMNGSGGLRAEYGYDDAGNQISVLNAWGNSMSMEYDDAHNLVKAVYPDKTFFALEYDKEKDWVMGYRGRDGCVERYQYDDAADPVFESGYSHIRATAIKHCSGVIKSRSEYEFWYRQKVDGSVFLHRVRASVNGGVTDITYDELTGQPSLKVTNDEKINYDFQRGR